VNAPPAIVVATTLLFVAACVASDVRTLRIPNRLTAPAMIAGLALNAWYSGADGLVASLAGLALGILLMAGPFVLGGIGGGDVKMMGAVGALLGPRLLLWSMGAGMIVGGVLMVAHLIRVARLGETLARLRRMIARAVRVRSLEPLRVSPDGGDAIVLPYSLPLGLGTLGVIALALARPA
jgi:prepilin peptidase CpaA